MYYSCEGTLQGLIVFLGIPFRIIQHPDSSRMLCFLGLPMNEARRLPSRHTLPSGFTANPKDFQPDHGRPKAVYAVLGILAVMLIFVTLGRHEGNKSSARALYVPQAIRGQAFGFPSVAPQQPHQLGHSHVKAIQAVVLDGANSGYVISFLPLPFAIYTRLSGVQLLCGCTAETWHEFASSFFS